MSINFKDMPLPKAINPCPIYEAIVELRFDTSFPNDAIFGVIYNEFKADYPKVDELPVLQIPEPIRKLDRNLQFKPGYKLTNNKDPNFIFQVGPKVFSLANTKPYAGWMEFSKRIKDILERVEKLKLIDSYSRIGVRYINGFEFNIWNKVNLTMVLSDQILNDYESYIRIEIPTSRFKSTLQISNRAEVNVDEQIKKGSIIDIDMYLEGPTNDIINLIEIGHEEEKQLFFYLLKNEFIEQELNPEY
jgi:uncharacterized protein (TIGR04255 family)